MNNNKKNPKSKESLTLYMVPRLSKLSVALTVLVLPIVLSQSSSMAQDSGSSESQPKLYEPYAPKPSGKAPDGWEIRILEGSQVENSTNLNGKKEIKVTVPAYELVPKTSDETKVMLDPGFDPKLATAQRATIGAVLTEYSEQTQELHTKLEKVIIELETGLGLKNQENPDKETDKKSQENKTKPNEGTNKGKTQSKTSRQN